MNIEECPEHLPGTHLPEVQSPTEGAPSILLLWRHNVITLLFLSP